MYMERRRFIGLLKIWFGDLEENPNYVYNTSAYFDIHFDGCWITSEFGRKVILDVDKSEVLDQYVIKSPVFGGMSPERLSGGVKTLLLMMFGKPEKVFNASTCGENCIKWIQYIGEQKDLTIRLGHFMMLNEPFKIEDMNTGKIITTNKELLSAEHYGVWEK